MNTVPLQKKESKITTAKNRGGDTPSFFTPIVVQKKLEIGDSEDQFEIEADRIADQVVAMQNSMPPLPPTKNMHTTIQRKCAHCEEEERIQKKALASTITPLIQRSTQTSKGNAEASPEITNKINTSRGSGSLMDAHTKGFMENRFGVDFSGVRIHTGSEAIQMSRALNAQAFTVGNDIYFNEGKYNPSDNSGKHLLAHELTHTLQQNSTHRIQKEEESNEQEASRIAGTPELREENEATDNFNYAFFYTGGGYGNSARVFFDTYYPEHIQVRSTSFESMFDRLYSDIQRRQRSGSSVHINEIVIITHANSAGGLQIPLARDDVRRRRNFNPWDLAALQEEFTDRTNTAWQRRQRFRERRRSVVEEAIDSSTRVIVRGCEFGQSRDGLDALRSFFGGHVSVWAPRGFQGYEVNEIGNSHIQNTTEAFEFLQAQQLIPQDLELSQQEQARYLAREMGIRGRVPAQFFVMGADDRVRLGTLIDAGRGRTEEAEALKVRGEDVEIESVGEFWNQSNSFLGFDPELDNLSLEEIERRARILQDNYQPRFAPMLLRLRRAWERHPDQLNLILEDQSGDPLGGLSLGVFGDRYTVNRDARLFEEYKPDSFETLQLPFAPPVEGGETTSFEEGFGDDVDADAIIAENHPRPSADSLQGGRLSVPSRARNHATSDQLEASRNFDKSINLTEENPIYVVDRPNGLPIPPGYMLQPGAAGLQSNLSAHIPEGRLYHLTSVSSSIEEGQIGDVASPLAGTSLSILRNLDAELMLRGFNSAGPDAIGIVGVPRAFTAGARIPESTSLWGHTAVYVRQGGNITTVRGFTVDSFLTTALNSGQIESGNLGVTATIANDSQLFTHTGSVSIEYPVAQELAESFVQSLPEVGSPTGSMPRLYTARPSVCNAGSNCGLWAITEAESALGGAIGPRNTGVSVTALGEAGAIVEGTASQGRLMRFIQATISNSEHATIPGNATGPAVAGQMSRTMTVIKWGGRVMIVVAVATIPLEVALAPEEERTRTLVGATSGFLGGLAGGAALGLACGPGAPVCSVITGIIGGTVGYFGTRAASEAIYDRVTE